MNFWIFDGYFSYIINNGKLSKIHRAVVTENDAFLDICLIFSSDNQQLHNLHLNNSLEPRYNQLFFIKLGKWVFDEFFIQILYKACRTGSCINS